MPGNFEDSAPQAYNEQCCRAVLHISRIMWVSVCERSRRSVPGAVPLEFSDTGTIRDVQGVCDGDVLIMYYGIIESTSLLVAKALVGA